MHNTDLKTEFPMLMASAPEIRIMAMAPAPEAVANATIESLFSIFLIKGRKVTKSNEVLFERLI